MARVAINGLGRIGRATLKIVMDTPGLDLVAANDLGTADDVAYLLKYDTVYGRYEKAVETTGDGHLIVGGRRLTLLRVEQPARLPWQSLAVDIVFECTGAFTKREDLDEHIRAGARYVILSAPSNSEDVETIVHGVNAPQGPTAIISCASCTTNCITPVMEILGRRLGVKKATMTTVHASPRVRRSWTRSARTPDEDGLPPRTWFPHRPAPRQRRPERYPSIAVDSTA
jgi:glyceraldehyde 3-phosphate dehydrogenase